MKYWEKFKSHKERGEWVELQFMAAAAQRRFAVSKPWGDTKPYDVGIEHEGNYLRVQVKSTTMRSGAGVPHPCAFFAQGGIPPNPCDSSNILGSLILVHISAHISAVAAWIIAILAAGNQSFRFELESRIDHFSRRGCRIL